MSISHVSRLCLLLALAFGLTAAQALGIAALMGTVIAGIASLLVSRRVVAPVKQMMQASQRIAKNAMTGTCAAISSCQRCAAVPSST